MITFLLTAVILSVLIFAGYRVNMYLYLRGAVGSSTRSISSLVEAFPNSSSNEETRAEQDYGMRYVRSAFLIATVFIIIVGAGLALILLMALY